MGTGVFWATESVEGREVTENTDSHMRVGGGRKSDGCEQERREEMRESEESYLRH